MTANTVGLRDIFCVTTPIQEDSWVDCMTINVNACTLSVRF